MSLLARAGTLALGQLDGAAAGAAVPAAAPAGTAADHPPAPAPAAVPHKPKRSNPFAAVAVLPGSAQLPSAGAPGQQQPKKPRTWCAAGGLSGPAVLAVLRLPRAQQDRAEAGGTSAGQLEALPMLALAGPPVAGELPQGEQSPGSPAQQRDGCSPGSYSGSNAAAAAEQPAAGGSKPSGAAAGPASTKGWEAEDQQAPPFASPRAYSRSCAFIAQLQAQVAAVQAQHVSAACPARGGPPEPLLPPLHTLVWEFVPALPQGAAAGVVAQS